MDPIVEAAKSGNTPRGLGALTAMISKGIKGLSPADRTTLMADAAVLAQSEIGKATDLLERGDDHERIGQIEDLWDGPPDDHLRTTRAHGPGSSAKPGDVPVGPTQAASGNGAEKMEMQYSRHAPQSGVQEATTRLGEAIAGIHGMRKAMKSFLGAFEAQALHLEAVKSSVVTAETIEEAVSKAVAKALANVQAETDRKIAKAVTLAVKSKSIVAAKAEGEKEDEKGEEDEEADEEESGEGTKNEVDVEIGEDDDDDKESAKSREAAQLRLYAKSRLRLAKSALVKAEEAEDEEKKEVAERFKKKGMKHMEKAMAFTVAAKALRGRVGPSLTAIEKAIVKARKGLSPSKAENQDIWPNKTAKQVGKSDAEAAAAAAAAGNTLDNPEIRKAAEALQECAAGYRMLIAKTEDMFKVVGSQSRPNTGTLPPAFALVKSGGDDLTDKERKIMALADNNVIGFDDMDRARDVITHMRMHVDQSTVDARISRLPAQVQEILRTQAAA